MKLFSHLFSRKKIKHKKPNKKAVQLKPKRISQKMANRLLLGFLFGMIGLATLAITSNAIRSVRQDKPVLQTKERDSRNISNKVGLFMTDFLNTYFSENSGENLVKLKGFYGAGIDIKNTQTTNVDSRLTGAVLIEITDTLATYRVGYSVKVNDEWQDNVGVINIPYGVKDNKYYVADLPYFTDEGSYVATGVKDKIYLGTQVDEGKYAKAKEYMEAFFKAYVSGDNTQMSPFSKKIKAISGYLFTSLDYTYFIEEDEKLIVVTQVTFTDGLGLEHQENFTVTLQVGKEETYQVSKLEHGVSKKYLSQLK